VRLKTYQLGAVPTSVQQQSIGEPASH